MPSPVARIAIALFFVAVLLYATFGMGGIDCQACLAYGGRSGCATVTAQERELAVSQAISTVCAGISSGVTDSMACARTQPTSVRCSE